MEKNRRKSTATILFLVVTLFISLMYLTGCGGGGSFAEGSSDSSGSAKVHIAYPQDEYSQIKATPSPTPEAVTYYLIDIYDYRNLSSPSPTPSAMPLIKVTDEDTPVVPTTRVEYPQDTAYISGIPVGEMLFVVQGFNEKDELIYYGEAVQDVRAGDNGMVDIELNQYSSSTKFSVSGRVTMQGNSFAGATVAIGELSISSVTDSNGEYLLENIPAGNYTLIVSGTGIMTTKINISVTNSNVTQDVAVNPLVYRASVGTGQVQATGDSYSGSSGHAISSGGEITVFHSGATNLVSGVPAGVTQVYAHNRITGVTELISKSSSGEPANGECVNPCVSNNGRYVAYESIADNLVTGDILGRWDIFVYDRQEGTTRRASVRSNFPLIGGNGDSYNASVSNDGNLVAFQSYADNLDNRAITINPFSQIYVHNFTDDTTYLVSIAPSGIISGNYGSYKPQISQNGNRIVFESSASNLMSFSDPLGITVTDIFVWDLAAGKMYLCSCVNGTSSAYHTVTGGNCGRPSISDDGEFVAFVSQANLLDGATVYANSQIMRRHVTGTLTQLISLKAGSVSAPCNSGCYAPCLSGNADFVGFETDSTDIISVTPNGKIQIYVRDMVNNDTVYISQSPLAAIPAAGDHCQLPSISSDGYYFSFQTLYPMVTADTNGKYDIYLRFW